MTIPAGAGRLMVHDPRRERLRWETLAELEVAPGETKSVRL